jgi:hypothetical protein
LSRLLIPRNGITIWLLVLFVATVAEGQNQSRFVVPPHTVQDTQTGIFNAVSIGDDTFCL